MKKTFWSIGILIVVVVVGSILFSWQKKSEIPALPESNENLPLSAYIKTPTGKDIALRVADSDLERNLGLSHFKFLGENQGMLFIFDKPGIYSFWMKDMNFPLDIIWLQRSGENLFQVVFIAENVDPSTYPIPISAEREADAVLEVNAGNAKKWGILVGTKLPSSR